MQKRYFPPQWVSLLKSKCDIIQVISSYIQVNKRGSVYWALCPFHHEKTPSFAINEDEQFYHCFGCGEGGDVIKFVQNIESISYTEAIEKLANSIGMELPEVEDGERIAKEKKEKDEILNALNFAMESYQNNLYKQTAKVAQEYVKSRKFKKSDLDIFHIGYADGNSVIQELIKKGFKTEVLIKAGIAGRDPESGAVYDRLSKRLIFPVLNSYEQCIAYSGRILEKSENRAKYKNTEQTPVFDKGSSIYAIDLLKKAKRSGELKKIILVEGQIDVIMMHSNGFKTAVASMGTAFTEKHAAQLLRFSDEIVLLYDGDEAGEKATIRTINILEKENFKIKIARLPKGQDPDEFLKSFGKEKMEKLIENAKSVVEYKLELIKEKNDLTKPEGKANYLKQSFEILNRINSLSEIDVYLKIISNEAKVPIDILRRDAEKLNIKQQNKEEKHVLISKEEGNIKAIKYVLKSILTNQTFSKLDFDLKQYLFNPVHYAILDKLNNSNIENLPTLLSEDEKKVYDEIMEFVSPIEGKNFFDECVWKIVESALKLKQQMLSEQYKTAETYQQRKEIAQELNTIIKQLNERKI